MSARKILHIIDNLNWGGAQNVVKGILEADSNRDDMFLFVLRTSDEVIDINYEKIIKYPSSLKYSFLPLFELKRFIKENEINYLHCHLFRSQVFGWLLKTIYYPEITLIFHEHGQAFGSETNFFVEVLIFRMFLRITKRNIDAFLAVSDATKRKLKKYIQIRDEKIHVIPNYIDFKTFKSNKDRSEDGLRKKLGIDENDFVIGFAGRLVERKGWELFIRVAHQLNEIIKVKYIVSGDGPDRDKLLGLIDKLQLKRSFHYLGYSTNMPEFYEALDCFVIPSQWEPFGIVALEAQALEVVVIASDIEGLNEIISHKVNGLLFRKQDPVDLLEKIMMIYNNATLREELRTNALNNLKQYSLDNYMVALMNFYHELGRSHRLEQYPGFGNQKKM